MYEAEPTAARSTAIEHLREVAAGDRFEFGENWSRFLAVIDDDRIREAERSFATMLGFPIWPKNSCGSSVELQQASEPLVAVDLPAFLLNQRRQ